MKTLEEIKDEVSINYGFKTWRRAYEYMNFEEHNKFIDECMQEYAKQVAEAQRKKCADENFNPEYGYYKDVLNTQLVTDNI